MCTISTTKTHNITYSLKSLQTETMIIKKLPPKPLPQRTRCQKFPKMRLPWLVWIWEENTAGMYHLQRLSRVEHYQWIFGQEFLARGNFILLYIHFLPTFCRETIVQKDGIDMSQLQILHFKKYYYESLRFPYRSSEFLFFHECCLSIFPLWHKIIFSTSHLPESLHL